MISGGLIALVLVSAFQAPGSAEHLPAEARQQQLTPALLQLRASVAGAAKADLNAQLRGKCKTDCKQDKEIGKLKGNAAEGRKAFDKLVMVAKEIDDILTDNDKLLEKTTDRLTEAIAKSKKDWEDVNEDLRIRIQDYKSGHGIKFAQANKQVDKTVQTVAAFFAHMKGKFVDMKDLIQYNKANVLDYLKVESQKSAKQVSRLGAAVAEMRATLQETMGATKGLLSQKIKDAATLNVGRVNAADEAVTQSVAKIEEKMNGDRTEQKDAAKLLKDLKKQLDKIDKQASTLSTKERKSADKEMGGRLDELNDSIRTMSKAQKEKMKELKDILKKVKEDITRETSMLAENNMAAVSQATERMNQLSNEKSDEMKEQQKKVFDQLIEKGLNAENVLQAIKYLAEFGDGELKKLQNTANDLRMSDMDAMRDLTTSWTDEYNGNKREFDKTSQEIVSDVRTNMKNLDSMSLETQKELSEKLDELVEKTDITDQDFEDKFAALQRQSIKGFDASTESMGEFYDRFAAMGVKADRLNQDTKKMIDTSEDAMKEATGLASEYSRDFGKGLKSELKAETERINGESEDMLKKMDEDSAASKHRFLDALSSVEQQSDQAMASSASELGSLSQKFASRQAEVQNKMAMNQNAEMKQLGKVHELDEEAAMTARDMQGDMDTLTRNLQNTKVGASAALAARLDATKTGLEGSITAQQQQQQRGVNQFIDASKASMAHEEGELRSFEGEMASGTDRFRKQADRSQGALRNLDSDSKALAAQVQADFKAASQALHNQLAQGDMATDAVKQLMLEKAQVLDRYGKDRIAHMGKDQEEAFRQACEARQAKIDEILSRGGTVDEAMRADIEKAEAEFAAKLHVLESGAATQTADVDKMARVQLAQMKSIEAAVVNAHDSERATQLLIAEDRDKQQKLLADAREKVISEIEKKTGKLDADVEAQIRAKMEDADGRIQKILNNEELEHSERQRQIEQIDAETRAEIARLSANQVQLDNQLRTFETDQGEATGAVDLQLKMLGGVLKDEQVAWLKGVLESKEELRKITETLTKEVDKLLKLFEMEDHEMAAKVEEAKASAKAKLASVGGQLAALSEKHGYIADEAIKMADLAEKAVSAENHQVNDEIADTEKDMTTAGAALHESDEETSSELAGERDARLKAMEQEREETTELIHGLLDKISDAAHAMSGAAVASGDKQRGLERKLRQIRTVLQEQKVQQLSSQLQVRGLLGFAPHAYLETRAARQSGLQAQRERIRALSTRATSRLTSAERQDQKLHRDMAALGGKVNSQDRDLFLLASRVSSQLNSVARDDDEQLREAQVEMDALQKQVGAPDFVEAPREPQLAQARLQQLEQEVSANEAKTRRYERENVLMRNKLEAAVQKELSRQLA